MPAFECVVGPITIDDPFAFDAYHDGYRVGVGFAAPGIAGGAILAIAPGDAFALHGAPTESCFCVTTDNCTRLPLLSLPLDQINATHNQRRVRIPDALVVRLIGSDCELIGKGGNTLITMRGGGLMCLAQWTTITDLEVLVSVGVGGCVSLDFLTCVVETSDTALSVCGWTHGKPLAPPSVYTLSCGSASGRRFSISPNARGVTWLCPQKHFNATWNGNMCSKCEATPLASQYDISLYWKGARYGDFSCFRMHAPLLQDILGPDPMKFVVNGGTEVDGEGIEALLLPVVQKWKTLLVQHAHPGMILKHNPLPVHILIGAQ
jgi:hypothetical protein